MFGRLVDAVGDLCVAHALGRVEHPELESGAHQAANGHVDVVLGDQSLREGAFQRLVGAPALEIAASGHAERRRPLGRLDDLVELVDIVDRPAVRDDIAVKSPVAAKDVDEQSLAGGCRVAVDAVVRAHDRLDAALLHERPERGEVGFVEVALRRARVEAMTVGLGAAMDGIVLRCRHDLQVLRVVAL